MGHSFSSSLFHCTFSTKGRRPLMTKELQAQLWPYMGGIARNNHMTALAIGGVEDHAHILLSLPSTMAIQLIKGGSSLWIHEKFLQYRDFSWQEGYGAFSIGISDVPRTKKYIANQEEHHRQKTFKEEFLAFLKKHGIEYERYIWN